MKVLYVSSGVGGHDLRFLRLFIDAGFEVACFVTGASGAVAALPKGALKSAAADLTGAIAQESPGVVVAGPIPDNGHLAAATGFSPLVLLSWGFDLLRDVQRDAATAIQAAEALRRAACIVCDCEAARDVAMRRSGLPESRFLIVPWGLERENLALAGADGGLRRALGWETQFVVVSTRSWEPAYRIDTVVEGFAQAHAVSPRLRLLLAGDGSLAPDIHTRIAALGLQQAVHCPGQLDRAGVMRACAAADTYVSASEVDGTSVSLLEAMASARPVVVSAIPGNREWVEPAACGVFFPVGDAAALAARLLEIERTPDTLRAAMGRRARDLVRARADWETNSAKIVQVLREAGMKREL